MKQGTYSRRSRGRGGSRKGGSPSGNRVIDSSGPEAKVRGNVHQVWEKYLALARDATASGDRILAEGYYQHAEHYYRMLNAANGDEGGARKGKGQQASQSSSKGGNGRDRQGGNGASRGGNEAEAAEATEAEVISKKAAEATGKAEVIPKKASKKASSENPEKTPEETSEEKPEETLGETSDGREALAIFPDATGTGADDAGEAPVDGSDEDAAKSDSAASK